MPNKKAFATQGSLPQLQRIAAWWFFATLPMLVGMFHFWWDNAWGVILLASSPFLLISLAVFLLLLKR